MSEPLWFDDAAGWRAWLEANHDRAPEVWVGMYKKHSARHNMTWSEAVDEALCFGWIDSVMHRIDDERHAQRFSPRKPASNWSAVNVAKIERLRAAGLMHDAGEDAFAKRREDRTGVYSFEQGEIAFDDSPIKANPAAWAFWERQPPKAISPCSKE